MKREPTCALCQGPMAREKQVVVQAGGSNVLVYTLAWVCRECSTAFPIATGRGGVFREAEPLYRGGQRTA